MLRRIIVPLILAIAAAGCATVSPESDFSPPRIALVGDSWPLIMRFHGGFKEAFVEEGYRPRQVRNIAIGWSYAGIGERRLAFQGIESYRYIEEDRFADLERAIERYPTIEIIHFTLGGADFLHDMPGGLPPYEQERYFREHVTPHIDAILTRLETSFPDKLIAFVGYDFLNFRDLRLEHKRTRQRWERLGRPDAAALNEMSWRLNQLQQEIVARHPGVMFVDVLGFTKERLGANGSFWEPSPRDGMWRDGMHLSREGNVALARYCLDMGYRERLMPLRDARGRLIPRSSDREP